MIVQVQLGPWKVDDFAEIVTTEDHRGTKHPDEFECRLLRYLLKEAEGWDFEANSQFFCYYGAHGTCPTHAQVVTALRRVLANERKISWSTEAGEPM